MDRRAARPIGVAGRVLALAVAMGGGASPTVAQETGREPPRPRVVVIDSVTVVDVAGARLVPGRRIVIRGDRIVAVEPQAAPPPDTVDVRLSGRGAYAIPGLVDHHVHLVPGMRGALERAARGGVTMVQAMAGDNRTAGEYARAVLAGELAGPVIAYASVVAGPAFFEDPRFIGSSLGYVPGVAPWAQAISRESDLPLKVAAARGSGAEVLKVYAMADSALVARVTAEAHRQGMRVVAHATVFPARPLDLVAAGVDVLTHAAYLSWQGAATIRDEDAWRRRDGPYATVAPDGAVIDAVLAAMRARGTALEPTLWVMSRRPEDAEIARWSAAVVARARAAGVPILAGTDGLVDRDSSALPNLHEELRLLVAAGLTPAEALAAATTVPARVMGRARTHGAVATGFAADLVLLEADPLRDITATTRIRRVVLRGRPLGR